MTTKKSLIRRVADLERRLVPLEAWYATYAYKPSGFNTAIGRDALSPKSITGAVDCTSHLLNNTKLGEDGR
jgi:hypothetical protein